MFIINKSRSILRRLMQNRLIRGSTHIYFFWTVARIFFIISLIIKISINPDSLLNIDLLNTGVFQKIPGNILIVLIFLVGWLAQNFAVAFGLHKGLQNNKSKSPQLI